MVDNLKNTNLEIKESNEHQILNLKNFRNVWNLRKFRDIENMKLKKYFFVNSTIIECKLCSFKGKFIVQHYRISHPESEVLISRCTPAIAEILIEDAVRNRDKYDKDHPKIDKTICKFKCPFCLMLIKDTAKTYYNHISSHTGEYCFHCDHCSYWTYNHTDIKSHLSEKHYKTNRIQYKMVCLDPKISKYIFGYICSECNFIQLIRAGVEEHAVVYHPGRPVIHKVNLGILLQESKKLEDLDVRQDSESDRKEMLQWINKNMVRAMTSISDKLQMKLCSEVKLYVIACVQSLTPKVEQFVLTSEDDSKCALVLTDVPMTDIEKQNRKCPKAVAVMMEPSLLNALYKCPKYYCNFATTVRLTFQKHLTAHHSILMDTMLPCLYCDYKISCCSYLIHLEVRHGHCLFGCGDCFYRTTNSYFITMHRELMHPNTKFNILQLDVVTLTRITTNTTSPNLSELVPPYNCKDDGFLSCPFKTLYFDEYLKHVEAIHQVDGLGSFSFEYEPQREVVMAAWLVKEVGPFQCRYCKKATVTHQEMGRHQAVFHAEEQCLFYYRKFVPNDTVIIPEQVNLENPSFINHVIHLPDQIHLCDFKLMDGFLSLTSTKLTNCESEVSLPLVLPPTEDIKPDPDQSSVPLDKPNAFSMLVNDEVCQLSKLDSCLDEQPNNGEAHNDTTVTACKLQCKWKDCHQTSDSQRALVKHIKKNHVWLQKGEKFTCFWIDCPKKSKPFTTKQNLLIHMRVHSGEKPYKCAFQGCDRAFSRMQYLSRHKRRHKGERPYLCKFPGCFKSFSHNSNRIIHQRTHYNTLQCKWKGCYETYNSQTALEKHIEKNHVWLQRGKKFTCFWINCPRKLKPYVNKDNLLVHTRVHSGKKTYKCTFQDCSRAFSRTHYLSRHKRKHRVERPYLCKFPGCFMSFSHNSNRIIHQRTHCNTVTSCSESYTDQSSLEIHVKNHTA